MEKLKNAYVSRASLILISLFFFASCAKKANNSSEKEKPKEAAPAKPTAIEVPPPPVDDPSPEAATTTPPPQTPAVTNPQTIAAPAASAPAGTALPAGTSIGSARSSIAPSVKPPESAVAETPKTCPISAEDITDPELALVCTDLLNEDEKKLEECLLQKVNDLTVLMRAEERKPNNDNLKMLFARAKHECKTMSDLEPALQAKLYQRLKEVAAQVFPESIEAVNAFIASANIQPNVPAPTPAKAENILNTTEYQFKSFLQYGSRDFRQKDGAVKYSISKIERKATMTNSKDETVAPFTNLSNSTKVIFSSIATYSFGLTPNANKMYTLNYKDEAGELTLDYAFFEGSLEAFKRGESARVVLTKASWLKVIEHETQKILNKYYPSTPRSAMKILLSPLDPPNARTCSIGKGYFLGSHAIACTDPEFKIRIQILEQ